MSMKSVLMEPPEYLPESVCVDGHEIKDLNPGEHSGWILMTAKKDQVKLPVKEKTKKSERRRLPKKDDDDDEDGEDDATPGYLKQGDTYYLYVVYKYTHDKNGKPCAKNNYFKKEIAKQCVSWYHPTRLWLALVGEEPPLSQIVEGSDKESKTKDGKAKDNKDGDSKDGGGEDSE